MLHTEAGKMAGELERAKYLTLQFIDENTLQKRACAVKVSLRLNELTERIVKAKNELGYDGTSELAEVQDWTIANAVLFAVSIMTTIGSVSLTF